MVRMGVSTQDQPRRRVTEQQRDLRFDAGALCLNLVATVGRRPHIPVERMGDAARLEAWCRGVGVSLAQGYDAAGLLASLHELRTAAFDIASSAVDGHAPAPQAIALVNRLARIHPPAPQMELTAGGPRSSPDSELLTAQELLSVIARDLIDLMSDDARRSRMRACAGETCRMIYVDTPGGRPRKWCSMRRCGNQAKAASHRRRSSPSQDGGPGAGPKDSPWTP
ncbi:CGNR zinc finger domain-containing protein [Streptomyces sp. 7R016]|uniref:CGNR zinc finger domain-containing protein n=2 Tax=Streptomyces TaxID=1883 RepID=A0ABS9XHR9_9ACTN|nr:CGNR zinc finger domain-containing protein [Streptomyces spinosisporus]WUB33626.1 CGNR zinc finger domain-containing protein [Streptomyces sp. NBC_00588]